MNLAKPTKIRSKKITMSAKNESCTLRIPSVCNHNPETVVFAHLGGNKGTGTKNHDIFGIYACSRCHDWMDGRLKHDGSFMGNRSHYATDEKLRALQETQLKLIEKGLIEVK